jgi:hypothetical protein
MDAQRDYGRAPTSGRYRKWTLEEEFKVALLMLIVAAIIVGGCILFFSAVNEDKPREQPRFEDLKRLTPVNFKP